jgi:hypothetical protein
MGATGIEEEEEEDDNGNEEEEDSTLLVSPKLNVNIIFPPLFELSN